MRNVAHVHVSADAKPRRDPCGCQDLRSRLGTYLRKAVANWQRDIRMALIGADDSLSIAHVLLGTSSKPQDRLERYTAFARSAMQRRLQPVDFGVLVQAYKRGTASGFAEAGMLPHNAPANGGFYVKQAENDLHGIGEEVIKRFSRTVATGLATGFSGSRLYRNVLPAFREVALPRVKLLATTLITTAYNGGKLDTFELLGKTHVGIVSETVPKTLTKDANFYKKGSRNVIVEYLTAGDDLVCPICEDLEGTYYTLAGARGLLPRHPNCRCSVELASDFNDAFDPDEPRDYHGRWSSSGGAKQAEPERGSEQLAAAQSIADKLADKYGLKSEVRWFEDEDLIDATPFLAMAGGKDILLSRANWKPETLAKYEKEWDGLVVNSTVEGVITHEYGHNLARAIKNANPEAYELIKSYAGMKNENEGVGAPATSAYAGENLSEFEAESFSGFHFDKAATDADFYKDGLTSAKELWGKLLKMPRR